MKNKYGLVMEGGAMRGMFTAGVLDVLMENNISFDGAIGVSAGAAFGCNYKSKQTGRVIRYNTKYCRDPRYCSFRSLVFTGDLYGADFCYKKLPEELDVFDGESFKASPMEFHIVATDIETGNPIYKKCESCTDANELLWLRASASMPLVSRIVEVDGYKLLDGGISDSVPLRYFESIGYNKNVVILTQPADYRKRKNKALPVLKLLLGKYPKLISALKNRHNVYNSTIEYISNAQKQGNTFVIRPPYKLPIGHIEHNPEVLMKVYNIGRKTAVDQLAELQQFLSE